MFYSQFPLADSTVLRIINPDLQRFYVTAIEKLMGIRSHVENRFPASNPVSLMRKDLIDIRNSRHFPWLITEKSDGTRFFLVLTHSPQKDPIALLVDRSWGIFILPGLTFSINLFLQGTIFDTEMVCEKPTAEEIAQLGTRPTLWILLAFDLLVHAGRSLRRLPFVDRYPIMKSCIEQAYLPKVGVDICVLRAKQFRILRELPELVKELNGNIRHANDGLIIQNGNAVYTVGMQKTVLKWKQKEKHTVDYLVHSIQLTKPDQWMVDLYVLDDGGQAVRSNHMLISKANCTQLGLNDIAELEMAILECYWSDRHGWRPLKLRNDKAEPNTEFTLRKTCENVQENIQIEELLELAGANQTAQTPALDGLLREDLATVLENDGNECF